MVRRISEVMHNGEQYVIGQSYARETKPITNGAVELGLRTIIHKPASNFTINAPSSISDGEEYILRVNSDNIYTMTLGTNISNPMNVNINLNDFATDQFVFLAVGGKLELQPEATF